MAELKNASLPRSPIRYGLRDPEGVFWEAYPCSDPLASSAKEMKEQARRLRSQHVSGYDQHFVPVDGEWFSAERYGDNVVPWGGLVLTGDWVDTSCGDSPRQLQAPARFRDEENVTLYLRWRWDDPWTGHVQRCDTETDPFAFLRCPWSPNLLPTEPPKEEPEPTGGSSLRA